MAGTADRLLYQLKSRGPQVAATLAAACAITPMGAHKQLQALVAQGLVAFEDEPQGVGRPRRVWRLTDAAHGRFPDRHGELAVQLLRHAAEQLGPEVLDRLIAAREAEAETAYQSRLAACSTVAQRVQALARVRSEEGYMAQAMPGPDGAWWLVEDHCPICAAATQCQGFCRSELAVFRRCLGPDADVERTEHLLAGSRRCAYLIRPRQGCP
jgi:predicted ArsR family transcriptional regulator